MKISIFGAAAPRRLRVLAGSLAAACLLVAPAARAQDDVPQGRTIPEGWAESVEPAVEVEKPRAAMAALPVEARPPEVEETRSATSLTFVGSLLADGVLNFATLSMYTRTLQWIWYGLSAVEVGSAILIFVQHYRGVLSASMQPSELAACQPISLRWAPTSFPSTSTFAIRSTSG